MWFHKHLAVRKKCFGHNLETKTQLSNCLVCYIRLTISAASLLFLMAICLTSWRIFSQENVEWVSQNISAHDSFIQKGESKQESRLQRQEDIEQVKKQLEILYREWLLSRCYYDSGKSEEYMTDEEKKLKALQREKCKKIKLVEEQINRILTETEFTSSHEKNFYTNVDFRTIERLIDQFFRASEKMMPTTELFLCPERLSSGQMVQYRTCHNRITTRRPNRCAILKMRCA